MDRLSEPDVTYRVRGVKETKFAGQENDDPTRISIKQKNLIRGAVFNHVNLPIFLATFGKIDGGSVLLGQT